MAIDIRIVATLFERRLRRRMPLRGGGGHIVFDGFAVKWGAAEAPSE